MGGGSVTAQHASRKSEGEVSQSMRQSTVQLSVAILMSSFAFLALRGSAATPQTDHALVVDALTTMYAAATTDDLGRFRTVAASDFYAFDGGQRFTGDSLMEFIKNLHATGKIYVWRVTEPEVHIHGDMAWVTFVNRGSIQDASGTKATTWLESAILRKEPVGWSIKFLHSTRVQ